MPSVAKALRKRPDFPEVRSEIVALKKLEQEQKEVAVRIGKIEEALKEIEKQRQENSREQGIALAKLEEWKRPLVERRNNAAIAVQRCDKELATVELRIQESEAADRDLMKRLSILEATQPAPPDLETQMERIAAERARLPRERAEMIQARLGSAEACRAAKAKLVSEEELIAQADKNIAKTRGEFESRDRSLSESSPRAGRGSEAGAPATPERRGEKEPGLSQHRPPSRLAGNCAAERAAPPRQREASSRRR